MNKINNKLFYTVIFLSTINISITKKIYAKASPDSQILESPEKTGLEIKDRNCKSSVSTSYSSSSSSSCSSSSCNSSCTPNNTCNISSSNCGKKYSFSTSNQRHGLHYRSQGDNYAREITGWQWDIDRADMCENYGSAYLAYEYQQTFNSKRLAQAYFGTDTLKFAGSAVPNRKHNELVADNFGLSRTFRGEIELKPKIENQIVDIGLYIGFDSVLPGLFFRGHMPIVHTKWTLNGCTKNCSDLACKNPNDCASFPPCYAGSSVNPDTGQKTLPVKTTGDDFSDAVNSVASAQTIYQALSGDFLFGDMKTDWAAGKFDFVGNVDTRNGVAALDLNLGYDFILDDCYHLGAFARLVAPTGPKQRDGYVFSPVVGNGQFWELGAGFTTHAVLYAGEQSNFAIFAIGNITHMFNSKECRLFDFCGKPYSRYLLLKEFESNGTSLNYTGNLLSGATVNNRRVNVNIAVKGDAMVKLAWRYCGFGIDVGYEAYGTTHERIRFQDYDNGYNCSQSDKYYGIKGTSGTCMFMFPVGVVNSVNTVLPAGEIITDNITAQAGCPALIPGTVVKMEALTDNSTQPNTTAFKPAQYIEPKLKTPTCNVLLSSTSDTIPPTGIPLDDLTAHNGFIIAGNQIPKTVSPYDLNPKSAEAPAVFTNKIFTFINYTWMDECGWDPELGIGGEVEFDGLRDTKHEKYGCGLYQWGAWLKGSINF